MQAEEIIDLFTQTDLCVREALNEVSDWGLLKSNQQAHSGQHNSDIVADAKALEILSSSSSVVGVLSEESGWSFPNNKSKFLEDFSKKPDISTLSFDYTQLEDGEIIVVMDPVDGSANAAKGIPWYAISLCGIDNAGPVAAYVSNLAINDPPAYTAIRNNGAKYKSTKHKDKNKPIQPSKVKNLNEALVSFNCYPNEGNPKWLAPARQLRSFGAAALEICLVASGGLDVYTTAGTLSPWDYLAGMLICQEAGAEICDTQEKNLLTLSLETKRQTLVVSSLELLTEIKANIKGA